MFGKTALAQEVFDSARVLRNITADRLIPHTAFQSVMTSKNKEFTLSFWLRFDDAKKNVCVGYWSTSSDCADSVKADVILRNGRLIVRKRTRINSSMLSPVAETDFPIDYEGVQPSRGDLTDGWVFCSLSMSKDRTLLSLSRPGGKLFSKLFYIGLSDVLTTEDNFYFGKSPIVPCPQYDAPAEVTFVSVAPRYLATAEVLNLFYSQSTVSPSVRYYVPKDLDGSIGLYVKLKNQLSRKYMDVSAEGTIASVVLRDRDDAKSSQQFLLKSHPQSGITVSTREGKHMVEANDRTVSMLSDECQWEFVFVRNDANDKPLYAIRLHPAGSNRLLGCKKETEELYVTSSEAYNSSGDVTDAFLWSIDVLEK